MCVHSDSAKALAEDKEFLSWLSANGIRQELSAPYAKYQNGFVERHIQTIQNMISTALNTSGMTIGYWGEAAMWAKSTWNATPRDENGAKSPYYIVTGREIEMSFLHPFGCQAFSRISNEKQVKFHDKSIECIFLNYDTRSKGYRLRPRGDRYKTVLVRAQRDVTFHDHIFPRKIAKEKDEKGPKAIPIDLTSFSAPDRNIGQQSQSQAPPAQVPPTTPPIMPATPITPNTPPLVLPNASNGAANQNVYYPSVFERQMAENPPPEGLRNGKQHHAHSINMIEILEPEAFAFHMERTEADFDPLPIDTLIIEHLAQMSDDREPKTIDEARSIPAFVKAADDEIKMIREFNTFTLVPREAVPPGVTTYRPVWRFRYKADGKAKARLCFPGHRQEFGVNYDQTESPTLHLTSFRIFLTYAHLRQATIRHVDIKNAYLHATVDEDVYMEQPPGYVDPERPNYVCKMNRALYGLKQAGRLWNKLADSILRSAGLTRNDYDPCVYLDAIGSEDWIIVMIFVDDFLITGSPRRVERLIDFLKTRLSISSDDEISRYIGITIRKNSDGDFLLSQTDEIEACIRKFGMQGAKAVPTPSDPSLIHAECLSDVPVSPSEYRSLIGALLYFAMCTRPDIAHATITCAQFQRSPNARAWAAAKRILRYLIGTSTMSLRIAPRSTDLEVFSDASHGDPSMDRYSVSGTIVFLGGSPIHWTSRKQRTPAHSSTEAELVAASSAARDALWIARLTAPIGTKFPIKIWIDNKSTIMVASSEGMLRRVKHLEVQDVYIRSLNAQGLIRIEYVPSESNWADALTKAIKSAEHFKELRDAIVRGLRGGDRNRAAITPTMTSA